jgi:hypothetical protein
MKGWLLGGHHFTGVGVEGNNNSFSPYTGRFLFQLLQYLPVAQVNSVERAYGKYCPVKGRNIVCRIVVHFHKCGAKIQYEVGSRKSEMGSLKF